MSQAAEETEDQGVFEPLFLFYNDSPTVLVLGDALELGNSP